jgi:hypothetical protein
MTYCYDNDEAILEMQERMQELQGGFSLQDLMLPVTTKIEWLQNEYDDDKERFQYLTHRMLSFPPRLREMLLTWENTWLSERTGLGNARKEEMKEKRFERVSKYLALTKTFLEQLTWSEQQSETSILSLQMIIEAGLLSNVGNFRQLFIDDNFRILIVNAIQFDDRVGNLLNLMEMKFGHTKTWQNYYANLTKFQDETSDEVHNVYEDLRTQEFWPVRDNVHTLIISVDGDLTYNEQNYMDELLRNDSLKEVRVHQFSPCESTNWQQQMQVKLCENRGIFKTILLCNLALGNQGLHNQQYLWKDILNMVEQLFMNDPLPLIL